MRIVQLTASNIKRLTAIDITPDGTLQVIAGRNGQGKTSVLDAIWLALGGADARKDNVRPVRDGADRAEVRVDLGDLVVTRTFTAAGGTNLIVAARDGARYPSPQTMLDRLVGELSFDPLAFANLPSKEQVAQLLALIDLPFDLDELTRDRSVAYSERTNIGRDVARLRHQVEALPVVSDEIPAEPINVAALLGDLEEAQQDRQRRRRADLELERANTVLEQLRDVAADLEQKLTEALAAVDDATFRRDAADADVEQWAQVPAADVDGIRARIAAADTVNQQVAQRHTNAGVVAEFERFRTQYNELTEYINTLDETKRSGLAGANFPVAGLGFDDTGVTYNGIPLAQCSGAERLRVSLAIAMALNPRLRVIRITDGSLLDSANMALLEEMAGANDFQVWVERVDESGAVGIVIEDGAVREPAQVWPEDPDAIAAELGVDLGEPGEVYA